MKLLGRILLWPFEKALNLMFRRHLKQQAKRIRKTRSSAFFSIDP